MNAPGIMAIMKSKQRSQPLLCGVPRKISGKNVSAVTGKITGLLTLADKTHIGLVNIHYIIMFKIMKIK